MKVKIIADYAPKATEQLKARCAKAGLNHAELKYDAVSLVEGSGGKADSWAEQLEAIATDIRNTAINTGKAVNVAHITGAWLLAQALSIGFQTAHYVDSLGLPEIDGPAKAATAPADEVTL